MNPKDAHGSNNGNKNHAKEALVKMTKIQLTPEQKMTIIKKAHAVLQGNK